MDILYFIFYILIIVSKIFFMDMFSKKFKMMRVDESYFYITKTILEHINNICTLEDFILTEEGRLSNG